MNWKELLICFSYSFVRKIICFKMVLMSVFVLLSCDWKLSSVFFLFEIVIFLGGEGESKWSWKEDFCGVEGMLFEVLMIFSFLLISFKLLLEFVKFLLILLLFVFIFKFGYKSFLIIFTSFEYSCFNLKIISFFF